MVNVNDFVIENGVLYNCFSTEQCIVIPDGVKEIAPQAFENNTSATKIIIGKDVVYFPKWIMENREIDVDPENKKFYSVEGVLYLKGNDGLWLVACPTSKKGEFIVPENVVRIDRLAFENCKEITAIKVSESVNYIEYSAFCGCSKLKYIFALGKSEFYGRSFAIENDMLIPLICPKASLKYDYFRLHKINLTLGFLYNSEIYCSEEMNFKPNRVGEWYEKEETFAHFAMSQKRYILPYIFRLDEPKLLQFYVDNNGITKKNFEKMFLCPAKEVSAERCVAFLLDWESENKEK